jgi:ATP-binding cassette subfamily F protein 2
MPAKKKSEKEKPEKSSSKAGASSGKSATPAPGGANAAEESAADKLRRDGIITTFALSTKKMHRNVRDINVLNLTVTLNGEPLIDDAELSLNYGNRYGFIGRNGCGKSTFMNVIGARSFPIPDGIDIFHLKEEIEASDMTAKEAVMSVDAERAKLEAEVEELNELMLVESEENDDAMERLTQVYERLEELDAATAEVRASKILSGLGFTPEKQNKKTKEFSGGWRMRIALARALFIQPTLLLLDEPTNHLDMDAVVWLEDYLSKWNKILFMVSHSQDFMNNVCTHIVHLHKKHLFYYTGNYDQFVTTRVEKEEEQEKRFKSEQDQIKHMKEYVARFGQGNAKMARQAQSKEKILDKMLKSGLTEKVDHEKALDFKFSDPGKLSPPVLQCNSVTFGYPGCEILYSNIDFGVDLDSRVALVGPNGAGKSTLLKLLTGDLQPVIGDIRPHAHLRISKFSQHFIDVLDLSLCPLDYFMQLWPDLTREDCRKFLGRYGITGSVQTQVMEQLSDGQKSRVVFAKMAKEMPHILFLDEPTNHLDMESIDSLAKAVNQFEGGMVLVSHDMRLISQVANEIWMCDNKTVTKYVGDIADFKMRLRAQVLGDGKAASNLDSTCFVPLTPLKPGQSSKVAMLVAPPLPAPAPITISVASKKMTTPSPAPPAPPAAAGELSEEDLVLKARRELAEAKAKAAAATTTPSPAPTAAIVNAKPARESTPNVDDEANKEPAPAASIQYSSMVTPDGEPVLDEKTLAKMKKKAEKDARAAEEARVEAERQKRREEKLKDIEDAKKLKADSERARQEWLAQKAEKDAKAKAEEEAEAAKVAEAVAKRKEEREARKRARAQARVEAEAAARHAAEQRILADPWTQEQQESFETALLEFTAHCKLDKAERWARIAEAVPGKTRNQCLDRYKFLKDYVRQKKKLAAQESMPDFML